MKVYLCGQCKSNIKSCVHIEETDNIPGGCVQDHHSDWKLIWPVPGVPKLELSIIKNREKQFKLEIKQLENSLANSKSHNKKAKKEIKDLKNLLIDDKAPKNGLLGCDILRSRLEDSEKLAAGRLKIIDFQIEQNRKICKEIDRINQCQK